MAGRAKTCAQKQKMRCWRRQTAQYKRRRVRRARHSDRLPKGNIMTTHARGSFDVALIPQAEDSSEGASLGRYSIDKQFHGDLEGTSKGEMLSAGTPSGSAVYVAIERVTGTLHGRSGT